MHGLKVETTSKLNLENAARSCDGGSGSVWKLSKIWLTQCIKI